MRYEALWKVDLLPAKTRKLFFWIAILAEVLLVLGLLHKRHEINIKATAYPQPVLGEVTVVNEAGGSTNPYWVIGYMYTVDGFEYHRSYELRKRELERFPLPKAGDLVNVMYSPGNPQDAYAKEEPAVTVTWLDWALPILVGMYAMRVWPRRGPLSDLMEPTDA
jgi:hypothetical protein